VIPELMEEELQLRIHGEASLPTLVYLPGLHGDWTLIGSFRSAVAGKVRFVEMTYPRTITWSLDDYAAAIESALAQNGIESGWLLGESFGSQPLWALLARKTFQPQGIILAGGFVRLPTRWILCWAERLAGRIGLALLTQIIFPATNRLFARYYATLSRYRFRHASETLAKINIFLERRTPLDFQAALHRLHLIAGNNPCAIARNVTAPVFAISGWLDPIVPWFAVRRWLRKHCPTLREFKIIRGDHAVLITASRISAKQILKWMNGVTDASAGRRVRPTDSPRWDSLCH
jgi:pimeloyl-ACP methyl ester carboxylesterase